MHPFLFIKLSWPGAITGRKYSWSLNQRPAKLRIEAIGKEC